ncbi:hypothetical protein GXW82_33665 [Streptacidiphilus sp. 4-A2]|nr:hypothetical protein [Streptacidiphilus sp. 4-A2]
MTSSLSQCRKSTHSLLRLAVRGWVGSAPTPSSARASISDSTSWPSRCWKFSSMSSCVMSVSPMG